MKTSHKIILIRHSYDDHSYIDGKNDTSLTENGIEIANEALQKLAPRFKSQDIMIRHSVKVRAKETAQILCSELEKGSNKIECISDHGLTELFQGKFDFKEMEHEERVNFLQSCWDDFEIEREKGNLHHRFGEYKSKDTMLTFGENHVEWSVRIAGGLLNILNDLENNKQSINITHRGAMLEIQNLVRMANGEIEMEEVEKYKTIFMKYCEMFELEIKDIAVAKQNLLNFIKMRG